PFRILAQLSADIIYHFFQLLKVSIVVNPNIKVDVGVFHSHVGGYGDLAVGDMVYHAVQITQDSLTQGYAFDHTGHSLVYFYYIANTVMIFSQDKEASQKILDH